MPTYHIGDRVLIRTSAGEFPGTVRVVNDDGGGSPVYLVKLDPRGGSALPKLLATGSHLRPLDDAADRPLVVIG